METVINNNNFESEVIKSNIPVLLDFWATWCGPCRMIAEEVEKIAQEFDGKIKVGKVNVDEELLLAQKFNVEVIPTLILIKDGKEEKRTTGYYKKDEIKENFNF